MNLDLALNFFDISIILFYFICIFYLSFRVTNKGKFLNSEDYFLAGKDMSWFLVGASLFASNIGSEHLIGLAGSGASTGVVVSQFELLACFILLLLGWFFVPFYMRTGVTTMPEFLERRYSVQARNYLTFISIIAYILTKISVTIYAGAVVFQAIGVPFWIGAGVVVVATGIYTVFGGLKAVVYTDAVQMFIMILGAIFITFFGLQKLGGIQELTQSVPEDFFSLWRSASHPEFPWTGILFGAPILGVWYWCTDQYVVQRTLSAKNQTEARKGSLFAGYLKVLPLFIFVIPGIICLALSNKGYLTLEKNDLALPTLAANVLPTGIKGIFIAGLLSALMSSLSSVFNSCSTLITYEVFKRRMPEASEQKLISIGRWSTFILVIFGILWIPMMDYVSGELFTYIQSVQAYIAPPIAAVFIFGLLSKTINAKGALTALYSGFVLGILRLAMEIAHKRSPFENPLVESFVSMNFLHFAIFLFIVTSVLMFIVSKVSSENSVEVTTRKEFPFLSFKELRSNASNLEVIFSFGLILLVLSLWLIFS
jgi:SSS family solute:Na+ symporter